MVFTQAFFLAILLLAGNQSAAAEDPQSAIALPQGATGIGFDDLRYSTTLKKILVPGGRTGMLDLIDPESRAVTGIQGFSSQKSYGGGHGEGITSVDEGRGLLFVTDRSAKKVSVIDAGTQKIISSAQLGLSPDYVRFVSATNELWVTEPDSDRLEIFQLSQKPGTSPVHAAFVDVQGGPESLVIDLTRGKAYTHLWEGKTVAIDLKGRKIVSTWSNTCKGSRGIALDETAGVLFAGCSEGTAVSMDVTHDGKLLGTASSGSGVDIIDFDPQLRHLYLPGAGSATMAIISVGKDGSLRLLKTVPTVKGAHCVVTDRRSNAYVCDPDNGRLLVIHDEF